MSKVQYRVTSDLARNIVYIYLEGFFRENDALTASNEVVTEISRMKDKFAVVTDISKCIPADFKAISHLKKTQSFIKQSNVGLVIRIVGSSILAWLQISRASKEVGYEAIKVNSLQEAENILIEKGYS